MDDTNNYKSLRYYMEIKYSSAYIGAMSKLFVQNPYDSRGLLKAEYVLTGKEKEALLFYVPSPENIDLLDKTATTKLEEIRKFVQEVGDTLAKRVGKDAQTASPSAEAYNKFLDNVSKNTKKIVEGAKQSDNTDVPWEIVGVEFKSSEIEKKYGREVYEKANAEVPGEIVPGKRMYIRDFSNASRKLAHIIHEGITASPLIDLELFMRLLEQKGIPSYIDFETNMYYYNAQQKKPGSKS
jgi:hypothetical protein